jgi:hypothetical protein
MGPVSCGFIFFEAKNIKAAAATHLEYAPWGFAFKLYLDTVILLLAILLGDCWELL